MTEALKDFQRFVKLQPTGKIPCLLTKTLHFLQIPYNYSMLKDISLCSTNFLQALLMRARSG